MLNMSENLYALRDQLNLITTPETNISIARAIELFLVAKNAQRISQNTISDYRVTLNRFETFVGRDTIIDSITPDHVREFLAGLPLSKKSVLNAHIALSSLWTWALRDGYCSDHILRRVSPPRPEVRTIRALSHDDIAKLLANVGPRNTARDRAIILMLLDTGVRASELCDLKIGDIQDSCITVFGKGDKERVIPLSARTLRAQLDYLATRRKARLKDPLFVVRKGTPMDRNLLGRWLARLGEKAGVSDVHPHRFRHTFAISYLRNGGDAISLQKLLGHSTLDMVKRYVELASEDFLVIHKRASPVENWKL